MIAANDTKLSNLLKMNLDEVVEPHETLIIKRGYGIGSVTIPPHECNLMPETVRLLSFANKCQLFI